jgi:hypothetical protein
MHGAWFWLGAFVIYFLLGWLLSAYACYSRCCETRKVLGSWQVWVIYRLTWWITLAYVACAVPTFIALIVFSLIEWLFDAGCGHMIGWCGRPCRDGRDDCGGEGRRGWTSTGFNHHGDWCNEWGSGRLFWRRAVYDFIAGLVGIGIGAGFLPLGYLPDGVYGAMEGWAITFWVGAGLIAFIGTLLYHFFVRHASSGESRCILIDFHTQLIIQYGFLLILGVLSGAPFYVAVIWIIIWEILDFFFGWCINSFREPGWKSLDAILFGSIAFVIGAELIRPLLDRNMYAGDYA